jgi:hypothetical protein
MLCTTHPTFPLDLWDELLPQCELTLNLLRPYTVDPKMSAYLGIHGKPYDFFKHPLAPVGTPVLIHETPAVRAFWAPHGVPGFYLGPALDHKRCFRVFTTQTQQTRTSDTLAWLPTAFKMPGASTFELIHATIFDLSAGITAANASPLTAGERQPFDRLAYTATTALHALQDSFRATPVAERVAHMPLPALLPPAPTPPLQRVESPPTVPPLTQLVLPTPGGAQRVSSTPPPAPEPTPTPPTAPTPAPGPAPKPTSRKDQLHLNGGKRTQRRAQPKGCTTSGTASRPPSGHQRNRHCSRGASLAHVRAQYPPALPLPWDTDLPRELAYQCRYAYAFSVLNLDQKGQPPTYASAKRGPDAAK